MNANPWAWTLPTTLVVIGWVVSLLIAAAGWWQASKKDKANAAAAREKAEADARQADRMNAILRSRLEAAQESVKALEAQVTQLQEANRIAAEANPFSVIPWSDAESVGHGEFAVRNKSARDVIVTSVTATDERLSTLLYFDGDTPFVCKPNDLLVYVAIGTFQTGTPDVSIGWRWDGSDEEHVTVRKNIK
ncbi:hypothetical protein [Bifidobacterium thermacidophilum]|uniref:Uncharacterized protein n=1 Tax=Bifidobacterium thermacidophilum subsp. thermacidophilum TaxID=79262 RepID=A0A087E4G5_9BIFI|nr:hypothetical protein [Bifidobacterium thermacidophilum]KFJ02666.1 hypothetical protein THER5_1129 [Bifidobacterium thermacidophilum subsp. thermacidophilum]